MSVITVPDACNLSQPRPWTLVAIDNFDFETAHAEGWTVSLAPPVSAEEHGIQLQRLDSPECRGPLFADDRHAWAHVVNRARQGSALHRQALRLIDEIERRLIEALHGPW